MAPPDRIESVCLECGAANRPGETACFLCGRSLDTARPATMTGVPKSAAPTTSPELFNPYEPPTTILSPGLTFRISSLLLLIVAVAVCLAVAHEDWIVGIALAAAVAPALGYTSIMASRSAAEGRPMEVFQKVWSFLAALCGVVVIALSALIAFCLTCIPAGFVALNVGDLGSYLALGIGGTAGVAAAAYMTYYLLTRKRWSARTPR
ncbi:MAG: hypothetical protein ACLQIB_46815 [Isosphaeraceae bacterium]